MHKRNRRHRKNNNPQQPQRQSSIYIKKDPIAMIREDQIREGKKMMERERLENIESTIKEEKYEENQLCSPNPVEGKIEVK